MGLCPRGPPHASPGRNTAGAGGRAADAGGDPLRIKLRTAKAFSEELPIDAGCEGWRRPRGAEREEPALCGAARVGGGAGGEGLFFFFFFLFLKRDDCSEVLPPDPSSAAPHRRTPPPGRAPSPAPAPRAPAEDAARGSGARTFAAAGGPGAGRGGGRKGAARGPGPDFIPRSNRPVSCACVTRFIQKRRKDGLLPWSRPWPG